MYRIIIILFILAGTLPGLAPDPSTQYAFLPLAIPIAMTAIGVGGKIFSAIKGGKAMKEVSGQVDAQENRLQSWYDTESNRDYLSTNAARAAFTNVLQNIEEQNKSAESSGAITGATDAAILAEKESGRKQLAETASGIAAQGTARKDTMDQTYLQGMNNISQQRMAIAQGKADNAATLSSASGDLMSSAAGLVGQTKWGSGANEEGGN